MVVKFNFEHQMAFIRFIATHEEYDKINSNRI
ncbi:type II toxin-antitoxin system HigB family toxin [Thermophagus sp. OGC60D27]